MPLRVKIGDIMEITTSKGLAYAQYTHSAKGHGGAIIRILDGFFERRPENFTELTKKKHKFVTIFPLVAAVNRKIFNVVGHADIPEDAKKFPLFRTAGGITRDGKVTNWWLWDGVNSWNVGQLTHEQYKLPIQSVPSAPVLVEMIEEGWKPETDRWRGVNTTPPG